MADLKLNEADSEIYSTDETDNDKVSFDNVVGEEQEVEKEEQSEDEGSEKEEQQSDEAPSEDENNEADDSDEFKLPEPVKKKDKLPDYIKNKIEKERRKNAELQARLDAFQQQQHQQQQQFGNTPSYQPKENLGFFPVPEPRRSDFTNDEEFIESRVQYTIKKQEFEYFKNQQEQENVKQYENIVNIGKKYEADFLEAELEGFERYDDFEEVVQPLKAPGFPSNLVMGRAILDSPYKTEILYTLGKNAKKAREIASLSPERDAIKIIKQIAELEFRLKNRDKKVSRSKAPAPAEPVRSANDRAGKSIQDVANNGSLKEWEKIYKEKIAKSESW